MIRTLSVTLFGVAILVAFIQGNYTAMFGIAVFGIFLHVLLDELSKSSGGPASLRDMDPITGFQGLPLEPAPAPAPQPGPVNHTLTAAPAQTVVSDSFTILVAADANSPSLPASAGPLTTTQVGEVSGVPVFIDHYPVEAPEKAAAKLKARKPKTHAPAKKAEPKKPAAKKPAAKKPSPARRPTKKK